MKSLRSLVTISSTLSVSVLVALAACSGAKHSSDFGDGDGGVGSGGEGGSFGLGGGGEGGGACVGLQCQQATCSGGGTTSISGTVLDPAGVTPLYNVIVYVPNTAVTTPADGYATCDQCGSIANSPVVSTLTDTSGNFSLTNMPVGDNIPLVVQVGKWQRQYTIPHVEKCTDTPLDKAATRLPKNSTEGHIPKIAVTTGGYDSLECFLRKIGIDESEFSNGGGTGRVQLYQGEGGGSVINGSTPRAYGSSSAFWNDVNQLKANDIVALTCEGNEYGSDKPSTALDAMRDYTNGGGRVFATHYHYYWFKTEPATAGIASWSAPFSTAAHYTVDTSFPKGSDFADWLQNINATTTRGQIDLTEVANDVGAVSANAQRWIYQGASSSSYATQYMTFNTPVASAPADQCGRVVFSDIHVEAEDSPTNSGNSTFPALCGGAKITAQEQALEFLFFDLNSCVQDDSQKPQPPR